MAGNSDLSERNIGLIAVRLPLVMIESYKTKAKPAGEKDASESQWPSDECL